MRESFFFAASAASANLQHKTDGSHTNRPFFSCLMQDERETSFSQKDILPRYVFCFFSSRKKSSPLLFFLEEKTVSLRGKRSPSDGRLLFFLEEKKQKKIICGTVVSLLFCRFHQRASQNGRFTYEPSVFTFQAGRAGKHLFSERHPPPQCLLFLFFKKRNRPPFFSF